MLVKKSLGQRIKQARLQARLSQKTLGQALGLSDKAVSSYEVDRSQPNLEILKKISQVTKLPFAYFTQTKPAEEIEIEQRIARVEEELKEIKKLLLDKKS